MSSYLSDYVNDDASTANEEEDESGTRQTWEILTWLLVVFTLVLNLVLIGILLVRRNVYSVINKAIIIIAFFDLLYGIFVSPFFVENFVKLYWEQSVAYCQFFVYYFTFHDIFVPSLLILLSTYVSLKFAGVTDTFKYKKLIYILLFIGVLIFSLLISIPASYFSSVFDPYDDVKQCRSWDNYTMILSYFLSSSLLFCFTMSFLFSLCIVGSPFLRNLYDREEYSQRWRLLLTLSLVNGLYIVTGFLLNFKSISHIFYKCCEFDEPFLSINTLTYEVWSFVLLLCEPFLRPLMYLLFYFKYLLTDYSAY